jgi:hypothetical protein
MFLQLDRRNMGAGWNVELVGAQNTGTDTYQAFIKGTQSLSLQTAIVPPAANSLGTTLKENLVVPPKAGGRVATVAIPSGVAPVYVKVSPGSTLWIANYNFDDNDNQFVDLDGKLFLPPNGPNGLPQHLLGRAIESVEQKFRLTLVPKARLGALVGSWSNFANGDGFLIGDGVQVAVPPGANFLALAINDFIGLYGDNAGTGFRVKIIQRPVAQAGLLQRIEGRVVRSVLAQRPPVAPIPLADVIPRVCVNGYEDTERTAPINGTNFRLFRYVGNVCTGAVNVFPPGRSRKPDPGDPFEGGGPRGCTGRQGNAAAPGMILFVGLCWIGLRTHQGRA